MTPPGPVLATSESRRSRAPRSKELGGCEAGSLRERLCVLACAAPGMLTACQLSEKQETLPSWPTLGTLGFFQLQRAI